MKKIVLSSLLAVSLLTANVEFYNIGTFEDIKTLIRYYEGNLTEASDIKSKLNIKKQYLEYKVNPFFGVVKKDGNEYSLIDLLKFIEEKDKDYIFNLISKNELSSVEKKLIEFYKDDLRFKDYFIKNNKNISLDLLNVEELIYFKGAIEKDLIEKNLGRTLKIEDINNTYKVYNNKKGCEFKTLTLKELEDFVGEEEIKKLFDLTEYEEILKDTLKYVLTNIDYLKENKDLKCNLILLEDEELNDMYYRYFKKNIKDIKNKVILEYTKKNFNNLELITKDNTLLEEHYRKIVKKYRFSSSSKNEDNIDINLIKNIIDYNNQSKSKISSMDLEIFIRKMFEPQFINEKEEIKELLKIYLTFNKEEKGISKLFKEVDIIKNNEEEFIEFLIINNLHNVKLHKRDYFNETILIPNLIKNEMLLGMYLENNFDYNTIKKMLEVVTVEEFTRLIKSKKLDLLTLITAMQTNSISIYQNGKWLNPIEGVYSYEAVLKHLRRGGTMGFWTKTFNQEKILSLYNSLTKEEIEDQIQLIAEKNKLEVFIEEIKKMILIAKMETKIQQQNSYKQTEIADYTNLIKISENMIFEIAKKDLSFVYLFEDDKEKLDLILMSYLEKNNKFELTIEETIKTLTNYKNKQFLEMLISITSLKDVKESSIAILKDFFKIVKEIEGDLSEGRVVYLLQVMKLNEERIEKVAFDIIRDI